MIDPTSGSIFAIFAVLLDDGTSGLDDPLTTEQINAVEDWFDSSLAALSATTPRGAKSIPSIPQGLPSFLYNLLHSLRQKMMTEADTILKKYEQDHADRDKAKSDKHYYERRNHELKQYRDVTWLRFLEEELNRHRAKKKSLLEKETTYHTKSGPC